MGKSNVTQSKEDKPLWKKWWFWVIIFLIIVGSLPKDENTTESKETKVKTESQSKPANAKPVEQEKPKKEEAINEEEEKSTESAPLTSGENGVLADDVFIGLGEDKKNYEEMFTYITKGNSEALTQMVAEGKVLFAPKGTPITVVDLGFINAHIQVIGTGQRGWVPVEYLARSGN